MSAEKTIDLETGEPDETESPSTRRRRERRGSSSGDSGSGSSGSSKKGSDRENTSLAGRLDTAFSKLADQMAARQDDELADAIREERRPMSQGLVSLTSSVTPLRVPLVIFVSLLEPILAFWRVGRILFVRFLMWRERKMAEAEQARADWEATQPTVPVEEGAALAG